MASLTGGARAARERVDRAIKAHRERRRQAREARDTYRRLYVGGRGALDELAPDWTEHQRDAYLVGAAGRDTWTRTLFLDWPPDVPAGGDWLTGLRLEGDVAVSLHVRPLDPTRAAGKLRLQRLWQVSSSQARALAGRLADPDTETAADDADALLRAVRAGRVRLFSCTLGVVLRAPTEGALDDLERTVRQHCALIGAPCRRATWRHLAGFHAYALPYGRDTIGHPRTLDTAVLAASFPYQGERVSMGRGVLWGRSVALAEPVLLDVWDDGAGFAAPHRISVGPTGWGKTTGTIAVVGQELAAPDPPDLIAIDPKGTDYAALTAELGGARVKMGVGSAHAVNVLDLPPFDADDPAADPVREQTRRVVGLLDVMASVQEGGDSGGLDPDQAAAAEEAVFAAYAEAGADKDEPTTWGLPPEQTPTLADVHRHLLGMAEAQHDGHARTLARRLGRYATGTLAALFGRRTTVALDAPVVSFDLSAVDRPLRPVAVYVIGAYVWRAARLRPRRRLFVMDEVAALLGHDSSAELVGDLYAQGRSFGLSVWSMSQLIADYERSEHGVRALDNAATVLLIRQAGGPAVEAAARRYGLTPEECAWLVDEAERGDGILCTPRGRVALHLDPSPMTLALLSKSPQQRDREAREAVETGRDTHRREGPSGGDASTGLVGRASDVLATAGDDVLGEAGDAGSGAPRRA